MHYRISCQCGDAVTVAETSAGTTIPCHCGRMIVIPSLRELRRITGTPLSAQPDMEIEALLLAGRLPEEEDCVLCGTITDNNVCCRTECERALVKYERPWWFWLIVFVMWVPIALFSPITVFFWPKRQRPIEHGKDRIYDLPLRICNQCKLQLTDEDEVKDAMWEVPVYRRLLEKYPDAKVSVPKA